MIEKSYLLFDVQSNSLLDILKHFKIDYKNIKYICIDVEGSEYQTLSGINFEFIRPELINIEIKNLGFNDLMNNKICKKTKRIKLLHTLKIILIVFL